MDFEPFWRQWVTLLGSVSSLTSLGAMLKLGLDPQCLDCKLTNLIECGISDIKQSLRNNATSLLRILRNSWNLGSSSKQMATLFME